MSESSAGNPARNLLFGLLAFQMNFIDRHALLAAFETWKNDKTRPIGPILADQGTISADLLTLVEGVVRALLSRHDDDPEKSLAALTPIGSMRTELETIADCQTRSSIDEPLSDRGEEFDPYATRVDWSGGVGATSASSGERFRVLHRLNEGGMGMISVALDTELDRSIALKEIREVAADNEAYRARFLAEAEITGKLEHPSIIPIYGLGTYADGRPYYAMRLIRGDKTGSLMDAIKSFYREPNPAGRAVEFRGLLRRFLDVCNAIEYAHSKNVLHRDLKPENILLGPYGETLVVDWGLAKADGRGESVMPDRGDQIRLTLSGDGYSPTLEGSAFGTPEYAPPEQMSGDLANVGPRSDVYGLGAILYCLMTGHSPFSRKGTELSELIEMIEVGAFPTPRQVRADAEKALEAICLKAMSRKPADRYESARALATDLERYLADEVVSVYREPWIMRCRRWARKNRSAATSSAAALIVILATLTIGLIVVGRSNTRLAAALNSETKAVKLAVEPTFRTSRPQFLRISVWHSTRWFQGGRRAIFQGFPRIGGRIFLTHESRTLKWMGSQEESPARIGESAWSSVGHPLEGDADDCLTTIHE